MDWDSRNSCTVLVAMAESVSPDFHGVINRAKGSLWDTAQLVPPSDCHGIIIINRQQ